MHIHEWCSITDANLQTIAPRFDILTELSIDLDQLKVASATKVFHLLQENTSIVWCFCTKSNEQFTCS